jgi:peroxiredoxin
MAMTEVARTAVTAPLASAANRHAGQGQPLRVIQLDSSGNFSAPVQSGPSESLTQMAPGHGSQVEGPPIGSLAQPFALPGINGNVVKLAEYRGRVVVLNFWAFWCDTWKAEMPNLRELSGEQDELEFSILSISVDGSRLAEFRDRIDGGQTPFPVLLDSDSSVSTAYRIAHVPTVVIIDGSGRVRFTAYGYPGNHVILGEIRRVESGSMRGR